MNRNPISRPHSILVLGLEPDVGVLPLAGAHDARVLVVAPALNSRLRHWTSDTDAAEEAARGRLRRCVRRLARSGLEVDGLVGDADPLQAIADALALFDADEILVAAQPETRPNWLARRLVDRARERFAIPVAALAPG